MSTWQRSLFAILCAALVASCISPPFPKQMALQHLPTLALLLALPFAARRIPLSDTAFTCLAAFLLLHILGARYIYSYVPYDRVVHFFFGALWVRPIQEICVRTFRVPRRFSYYTAFEFVLAFSMLYELFEWSLTLVLSPTKAGAYNGEQGDIWDAHKDMSLALAGACVSLLVMTLRNQYSTKASSG